MGRLDTLGMDFADLYAGPRGDLIYGMSPRRDRYKNQQTNYRVKISNIFR